MGKICSKLCPKSNIDQNLLLESLDRYDNLLSNLYDEPEIINKKEEIIDENIKSKEYVSKLDVPKEIEKITKIITTSITKHDLEVVQLNNPKKEEERQKEIERISENLLNSKRVPTTYIENVSSFGSNIKNSIIYETYHNPEKFVEKKEVEKSKEGTTLFIEGALFSLLENNDITCAIEKETKKENEAKTTLQLITSGEIFRKKISVSSEYGEEKNAKILSSEQEKQNFISQKKKELSIVFNCPESQILITNLRSGCLKYDFIKEGREPTDEELEKIAKDKAVKDIRMARLIEGCIIMPHMFDSRGDNKDGGWGIGQKRGPPGYLINYDPPIGYIGYGLRVLNQYDNGDNTWLDYSNVYGEWYIAYHGTQIDAAQSIISGGFRAGQGQVHEFDNNINPLSNAQYNICGRGVYCSPIIKETEGYGQGVMIQNKEYYFTFMCRVNPYQVRICGGYNNYWVVSGDDLNDLNAKKFDSEIRPYRILLKPK
jgi:hypothetical protein